MSLFRFRMSLHSKENIKNPNLGINDERKKSKPRLSDITKHEVKYSEITYSRTSLSKSKSAMKAKASIHSSVEYETLPSCNFYNLIEKPEIKIEALTNDSTPKTGSTSDSDKNTSNPKMLKITYVKSKGTKEMYLNPDAISYHRDRGLKRRVSDVVANDVKLETKDICYQHTEVDDQV